jgi:hypothetical protein
LLKRKVNPLAGRVPLPRCPGPAEVIQRCLFAKFGDAKLTEPDHDLMLRPLPFPGSSFLRWNRYAEVLAASRAWADANLEELAERDDPAFALLRESASVGGR